MIFNFIRYSGKCNDFIKYAICVLALTIALPLPGQVPVGQVSTTSMFPPAPDRLEAVQEVNQPSVNSSAQSVNPDEFFRQAIQDIQGHPVIAASIQLTVSIGGIQMRGRGHYCEKVVNRKRLMKMEVLFNVRDNHVRDNHVCELVHVFDGRYFWQVKSIDGERVIFQTDTFMKEENAAGNQVENADVPKIWGGLIKLLGQIYQYFDLNTITRYSNPNDQNEYWVLGGTWRKGYFPLDEFKEKSADQIIWSEVPDEVPDYMAVYIGAKDQFPYKIVYYRGSKKGNRIEITAIQFTEVTFDCRLGEDNFHFEPSMEEQAIIQQK